MDQALILAMGLHEKGRALMKKRNHSAALSHLAQADEQFKYDFTKHTLP